MAYKPGSFTAAVEDWVRRTKEKQTGVFRNSVQELFADAQTDVGSGGNMPVDTGFLRNSLLFEILDTGASFEGDTAYIIAIHGAEIGNTVQGVWTAEYAVHVHYGTEHFKPGYLWVPKAAQKWQDIVNKWALVAKGM